MSALKMSVEESRAHNERCKLMFDLNLAKERFVNDLHNLYSASRIQVGWVLPYMYLKATNFNGYKI